MHIFNRENKLQLKELLGRNLAIDFKITTATIFPILVCIYKVLYSKHYINDAVLTHEKIISSCLEKNLPGLNSEPVSISWQTFDQILSDQLKFEKFSANGLKKPLLNLHESSNKSIITTLPDLNDACIKTVDFYNRSMVINTNRNWYKKQKKLYVGVFNKETNVNNYSLKDNWASIASKKFCNSIKSVNLDELPTKLNATYTDNNSFLNKKLVSVNVPVNQKEIFFQQQLETVNKKLRQPKSDIVKQFKLHNSKIKATNIENKYFYTFNNKFTLIKIDKFTKKFTNIKNISCLKPVKNSFFSCEHNENLHNNKTETVLDKYLDNCSQVKPIFSINKINSKFYQLEHLLKKYSLKKNLTVLPNYAFSKEKAVNIFANYKPISQLKNLSKFSDSKNSNDSLNLTNSINYTKDFYLADYLNLTSNLKSSQKVLVLLEEFLFLNKNLEIAPRIMSGYVIPDTSNMYNLLCLAKSFYKNNLKFSREQTLHNLEFLKISKNTLIGMLNDLPIKKFNSILTVSDFNFLSKPIKYTVSKPIKYTDNKKSTYEGLGIIQNQLTNQVEMISSDKVTYSVKQLLGSDNFATDCQKNFFGNVKHKTKKINYVSVKSPLFVKKNYEKSFTTTFHAKTNKLKSLDQSDSFKGSQTVNPANIVFTVSKPNFVVYIDTFELNIALQKFNFIIENCSDIVLAEQLREFSDNHKIPTKSFYVPNNLQENYIKIDESNITDESNIEENLSSENTCNIEDGSNVKSKFSIESESDLILQRQQFLVNNEKTEIETGLIPTLWPLNQLEHQQTYDLLTNNKNLKLLLKEKPIVNYHYLPYSENLCKQNLPTQFLSNQAYKKTYSIYKYNNKLTQFGNLFYDAFQPISYDFSLFAIKVYLSLFLLILVEKSLQNYQKTIASFISQLLQQKDSTSQQADFDENTHSQFRIIKNIEKNFDNIAGIDSILPELSEIVWFFKNSRRWIKSKKTIPQNILLAGPPGTGKTLLVQAIAGEAEVPVLIESASGLFQSGSSANGSEKLKDLFIKARSIAPCIIFIDEIDTFGEARSTMMENPTLTNTILDSIYTSNRKINENFSLLAKPKPLNTSSQLFNENVSEITKNQLTNFQSSASFENKLRNAKYNVLIQFLIELDAISTQKKVLVFAATNRPQILDSALTRPGRFNKTLYLKLPNKQKRIEIVKLYSKKLGIEKKISWEYIANLTAGLSAADLASAVNQSAMQAIQAETIHTITSIEYGIESITGYSSQKNKLKNFTGCNIQKFFNLSIKQFKLQDKSKYLQNFQFRWSFHKLSDQTSDYQKFLFINRLAYYQAGKIIVHTLLKNHPNVISIKLWPELKSQRYHLMNGILEKEFSQIYRRIELESRLIGFYAGKAGEFISLFTTINKKKIPANKISSEKNIQIRNSLYKWQSDLGTQDISFASWLAELMVSKWYLYSKKISLQNFNQLENNLNSQHFSDISTINFFQSTALYNKNKAYKTTYTSQENSQNWVTKPWLQQQIIKKLEFSYLTKKDWYKIYGGDHEQNENTRYLVPEIYYHNNIYLNNLNACKFNSTKVLFNNKTINQETVTVKKIQKLGSENITDKYATKLQHKVKTSNIPLHSSPYQLNSNSSIISWNDISNVNRDYIYHNLILTCYNKAILIIDENRELFDLFATCLLQKEIFREYEILKVIQIFSKNLQTLPESSSKLLTNNTKSTHQLLGKPVFSSLSQSDQLLNTNKTITPLGFTQSKLISKKIQVIKQNWGKKSHSKFSRFINFKHL